MTGWQPIETAPKNGTPVVLWAEDGALVVMTWNPDGFNPIASFREGIWEAPGITWTEDRVGGGPTHWHPKPTDGALLPDPPA